MVNELAKIGTPSAEPLIVALHTCDVSSRGSFKAECLIAALGKTRDPKAVDALIVLFNRKDLQKDAGVILRLGKALGDLGDKKATPVLLDILKFCGNEYSNVDIIVALGNIADQRAAAPLMTLLRREGYYKTECAVALGKIGDKAVIPELVGMLNAEGDDAHNKSAAAIALGAMHDHRAIDSLLAASIADARSETRAIASDVLLAWSHTDTAVKELLAKRYGSTYADRLKAQMSIATHEWESLLDLGDPGIDTLLEALNIEFANGGDTSRHRGLAISFKEHLHGLDIAHVRRCTEGLNERNQAYILVLYFTLQTVRNGLTDSGLEWYAMGWKLEQQASELFDEETVRANLKLLAKTDPKNLPAILRSVTLAISIGDNPHSPESSTWAARVGHRLMTDVRLIELTRRSVAVKLLVLQGVLTVPDSTTVGFAYSGRDSITKELPPILWSRDEVSELTRLAEERDGPYRSAARKALAVLAGQKTEADDVKRLVMRLGSDHLDEAYRALHILTDNEVLSEDHLPLVVQLFKSNNWWRYQLAMMNVSGGALCERVAMK